MASIKPLNLTLTIHKPTNRVVFAEADKDFVDILLSFLTLPLATIIRLTDNKAPHCLNNLYKSFEDLGDEYVKLNPGKEVLLNPSHDAELDCLDLKVNIEGDRALAYYTCRQDCYAALISPYSNTKCNCGGLMNRKVNVRQKKRNESEGVFLEGAVLFMITDDFIITPASIQAGITLIGRLDMKLSDLEEKAVTAGQSEVLALLQNSLASDTAFTDTFLPKDLVAVTSQREKISLKYNPTPNTSHIKNISFKIIIDKHENKVLYAEGDRKFADLLFSFLIYPSGLVVKFLNKNSRVTCLDNLYASDQNISGSFKEYYTKKLLINPKLPSYYSLKRNFNIFEEMQMEYYLCRNSEYDSTCKVSITHTVFCECGHIINKAMRLVSPFENKYNSNYFVREATYIVTDDLVITPLRSISSMARLIANTKDGIRELVIIINIGEKEMFLLLEAANGLD